VESCNTLVLKTGVLTFYEVAIIPYVYMEKTARKPSADPTQERLRQNKANWNKEVSSFVNDLIHLKKMMNGWPSKWYKERSRITQPIPADPATIIGSMAGDFQEIVNKGNAIVQEQVNYAKTRRQRQPKQMNLPLGEPQQQPAAPPEPAAPKPDLSKQLSLGLASDQTRLSEMIKVAAAFEEKYFLESEASNPITRFVTRLFTPRFGFGEAARIRRLRMAMLDNCVKSYKELKKLHKEVVRSSKSSIVTSHKMMTQIWNYWNAVNRLFSTYKAIRPGAIVTDPGGEIETDPDLKREKALEEGRDPDEPAPDTSVQDATKLLFLMKDFVAARFSIVTKSSAFRDLNMIFESISAAPKNKKTEVLLQSNVADVYKRALQETNAELGTNGTSFQEIALLAKQKGPVSKEAQRQLGKFRHQILPGATSGQRLEIYRFIDQIKIDLDNVMNLLEKGFDQEQLTTALAQVNREMSGLRTMMRSLYYSEKPGEASSPFM
jgi:hypothetical protein